MGANRAGAIGDLTRLIANWGTALFVRQNYTRLDYPNEREISIILVNVQTIAEHKCVGNSEPCKLNFNWYFATLKLVQKRTYIYACRIPRGKQVDHFLKRTSRVDDVFDNQHVAPDDGCVQIHHNSN